MVDPVIALRQTSYSLEEATPEVSGEICVELQSPSELRVPFEVNFSVQQGTASKA